jgi:hypothetical protein
MSRSQQILKFLEKGGCGTDAELALLFAKQHEPKRGAEIIRSTICTLIKKGVHICKQTVDGQRKQEYYIPFAVPVKSVKVAKRPATIESRLHRFEDGMWYVCHPLF